MNLILLRHKDLFGEICSKLSYSWFVFPLSCDIPEVPADDLSTLLWLIVTSTSLDCVNYRNCLVYPRSFFALPKEISPCDSTRPCSACCAMESNQLKGKVLAGRWQTTGLFCGDADLGGNIQEVVDCILVSASPRQRFVFKWCTFDLNHLVTRCGFQFCKS